mgnify:FL=1
MKQIEITIKKPLYETDEGSIVRVYDKWVEQAIRFNKPLIVRSFWRGKEIGEALDPQEIKKHCKKVEQVFRYPNEPMILYEVFLKRPLTEEEELIKLAKQGIF